MPDKHLIYLTAWRATAYVWRSGSIGLAQHFPNDEDGFGSFATYLKTVAHGLVYVVADVVEEDFHVDQIPFVRGSDRRQLIGRRLSQRYRDTSLSLAMSLGIERAQRRDERILLSSFTNTQLFQPWLNVLRQSDLPLAGVYSMALVAPILAQRLGYRKGNALLVSLQPAGLRQTLVRDAQVRFSRLGPLDPTEVDQPTRVAAAFAGETVRIHQYLTAVRVLARDEPALDVVLVAPAGRRALVQGAASDTPQIHYRVLDVNEVADQIGLRGIPQGAGAEVLYLHLVAQQAPRDQYLGENLRTGYRLYQARRALLAAGAIALAVCAMFAGFQWWTIYDVRGQTEQLRAETRTLEDTYRRVTQGFPKIPTTVDNLKLTLQQFGAVQKRATAPEALLREVAAVMAEWPNVELDAIAWEQGVAGQKARGNDGSKAAAPTAPGTTPPKDSSAGAYYEVARVTARITGVAVNDYRTVADNVNGFLEKLRARPGLEVLARKLPFDIGSETSLSGDIGAPSGPDSAPVFLFTVGRKLAL
ncbi:MAG: hypothetical protein ABIU95_13750 [Burkholderiales bacterium]